TRGEIEERVLGLVREAFERKIAATGGEGFLQISRQVLLWTLDEKWRDHLYELDHLKGGIGLRAYGQKDPLLEYKREAFELFNVLLDEVHEESLRRLFRVQLAEAPPPVARRPARMVAHHAEAQAFGGGAAEGSAAESPAGATESKAASPLSRPA